MIKITYENHYNYIYKEQCLTMSFQSLEEFKEWLKSNIVGNINTSDYLWWPHRKNDCFISYSIRGKGNCYINLIENEKGIIFSDGKYTSNKTHMSNQFFEWCQEQIKEQEMTQYNFVD